MLELRGIACVRGTRSLFTGLDLTVPGGQLLRVQGANGAGKTSLLRMMCGLLAPAQGAILWRGQKISTLREEFNRELIFLGHAAALKDDLSALENLVTAARLGGLVVTPAQASMALAAAGLRGRDAAPARILSQGQRKRVSLARLVLGTETRLWVLDEPFNALDVAATAWLVEMMGAQVARGGIVVLTSHQTVAIDERVPQMALAL